MRIYFSNLLEYLLSVLFFRGYGLGSVFSSLLRFLKPIGKNVTRILKEPTTQKVLKSIGKEAASTGSELVLNKIQGNNNIESLLKERIQHAKNKIAKTVNTAMKQRKKKTSFFSNVPHKKKREKENFT